MGKSEKRVGAVTRPKAGTVDHESWDHKEKKARELRLEHESSTLEFPTVAMKIAKTKWFHLNYTIDKLKELYPYRPRMWSVDKYFPDAVIGPLFVDEPMVGYQIDEAYEKHKVLKKLGLKHIVIEKDTTVDQALEQLGEL